MQPSMGSEDLFSFLSLLMPFHTHNGSVMPAEQDYYCHLFSYGWSKEHFCASWYFSFFIALSKGEKKTDLV